MYFISSEAFRADGCRGTAGGRQANVAVRTLIMRFWMPTNSQLGGFVPPVERTPSLTPPVHRLIPFKLKACTRCHVCWGVSTISSIQNSTLAPSSTSLLRSPVRDAVSIAANPQRRGGVTLTAPWVLSPRPSGSSRRCWCSGDSLTGPKQTDNGRRHGHVTANGNVSFLPASRQCPPHPLPPTGLLPGQHEEREWGDAEHMRSRTLASEPIFFNILDSDYPDSLSYL